MMKWINITLMICCFTLLGAIEPVTLATLGRPQPTALQISIIPDALELYPSSTPVVGLNAEIFCGLQERVTGVNFQPLLGFSETIKGVSYQGFGQAGYFAGLQTGLFTFNRHFTGVNLALATSAWENRGVQIGLVNLSGNTAVPVGEGAGVPLDAGGVQFGLFNAANRGFQIGLLNYNSESMIPWMILVNWSFRE